MLFAANGLIGFPLSATDGRIGSVKDFLVDERGLRVRWMVVDTGDWLPGRKVLIHPLAVQRLQVPEKPAFPMLDSGSRLVVSVNLTRRQIEASPEAREGEPVTEELENRLSEHYGWNPISRSDEDTEPGPSGAEPLGDRPLASAAAIKGMAVQGVDGEIGLVDNVFLDDIRWTVRYLVVARRAWLSTKLVQAPISAISAIDWRGRTVRLDLARERFDSAPQWDPQRMADGMAEKRLLRHFGLQRDD